MSAPLSINPSAPVTSSNVLDLAIDGRLLRLILSFKLGTEAVGTSGLHVWVVLVTDSRMDDLAQTFKFKTGTGGQNRVPDPLSVVKSIASDLTLALQLPEDTDKAADFLFREGYAIWPSDALALRCELQRVQAAVTALLNNTGITLAAFAEHVCGIPYTPHCTLPSADPKMMAAS